MRMVSRTPQARSCCTTLLESYLRHTNATEPQMSPGEARMPFQRDRELPRSGAASGDSLKRELLVIGFNAAHVVWRGGVQRLHQQRQRAAELWMGKRQAPSVRFAPRRAGTGSRHSHLISHRGFQLPVGRSHSGPGGPHCHGPAVHRALSLLLVEKAGQKRKLMTAKEVKGVGLEANRHARETTAALPRWPS